MKTPNRWALIAIVGLLVAAADVARAQDESLKLIPGKSPIVIQINGLDKARGNLGKFLSNALPDVAPKLAKKLDDVITEIAKDRDLKSISKEGRIYVVVTDLKDLMSNPPIAVLVPVASYKEFKSGFLKDAERKSLKDEGDGIESAKFEDKEEPIYIASRKDYVVIAHEKDVAKTLVSHDPAKGLDATLSKETAASFLKQDIAVYISLKEISDEYGAQIRGFKPLLEQLLQGAGGMGVEKKQIEVIKLLINSGISLLDDGVAAILGVEFRPEGANLHFLAQFAPGSDTDAVLKKSTPAALKEMGSLPNGMLMYSASNFDTASSKTLSTLIQMQMADDESAEVRDTINKRLKELAELGRVVEFSANRDIYGGIEVSEFKDGAKAFAAELDLYKALTNSGSIGGVPLKEKPEIKEDAETVGGFKLTSMKITVDYDKAVMNLPEGSREAAKAAMEKVMGESSMIWIGRSGNKVMRVTARTFNAAKAMIEDYLSGRNPLDKDDSYSSTRKQLPAKSTILFLGDTARVIEMAMDLVKDQAAAIPGLGGIPDLKAPKGKPAYFGAAVAFKAEYVTFDLFVPVTAVQQVRKMFAPLIDGDN